MGRPLPEYTQEELNKLFARYILYNDQLDICDEDLDVLRHVANDWYILKRGKQNERTCND